MTHAAHLRPAALPRLADLCWLVFAINATAVSIIGIALWQTDIWGFTSIGYTGWKTFLFNTMVIALPLSVLAAEHITSVRSLTSEIEALDPVDATTGVLTRRVFECVLEDETRRLAQTGQTSAIATIHLDHYDWFQDRFGHAVADAALHRVAEISHRQLRSPFDKIARWSDTELIILLDTVVARQAEEVFEGLNDAVAEAGFDYQGEWYGITLSFGMAMFGPGRAASSAVDRAEEAVGKARQYGGNRLFTMV